MGVCLLESKFLCSLLRRGTNRDAQTLRPVTTNQSRPEGRGFNPIILMKEWLGHPLDPEAFDAEKVNTYLRKLKWPRTTEGQLRKVLMARDDYEA